MRSILSVIIFSMLFCACKSDGATQETRNQGNEDTLTIGSLDGSSVDVIDTNGHGPIMDGVDQPSVPAHHADRPSVIRTLTGIDITKNHRLTGPNGETILIPANSLVYMDGRPVTGKVQVTWNAALTLSELYAMRAPTMANGQLLGSGGAIYLEAEQDGLPLRIKEDMAWKVTVPGENITLFPKETMKVFNGQRRQGQVMWSLDPVERIETISLTYKYFLINDLEMKGRSHFARVDSIVKKYPATLSNTVTAPAAELAIGRDKARIAQLVLSFYDEPRYKNTYVYSIPFLARLRVLTQHVFGLTRTVNDIHYIDERSGANQFIIEILKLYSKYADRPMSIPDQMALALLSKKDAITNVTPGSMAIHIHKLREAYREFVSQELGHPIIINDHGVDLEAPDAFDQLVRKGLGLESASNILEQAADRRTCIDGLKVKDIVEPTDDGVVTESWIEDLPDGRRAVVRKRQTYTINFTGGPKYLNIDRFIGPEFTEPTNVFVTLQGPELSYERVCMFFPSLNGYLELQREADARIYRLPKALNRLPFGQPMAILVVGQNANGGAYHMVEGFIERSMNYRLEPRNGDMDALAERLSKI